MFPDRVLRLADEILAACRAGGLRLAVAESCTGGLVAGGLTAVPGSSDMVERGFVTYSDAAKGEMLGVPDSLLAAHGAVSAEVARAMAEGALERSSADLGVAVTGIAGPGGATAAKPVGLVHIAAARRGGDTVDERHVFSGDRAAVRLQAVEAALVLLLRQATAPGR